LPDTLLFIPDISGFTKFVNQTEVQHVQHVISELLEILIDANFLDLKLSEIEGDALFFYKQEDLPNQSIIADQARTMFLKFHQHLNQYQNNRICQCGACRSAGELTLKFIVHRGPVDFIKVKDQVKPYGSDVILAHRLLKNPISNPEYILFSESSLQGDLPANLDIPWLEIKSGQVDYDTIGSVGFHYGELTPLHDLVPATLDGPQGKKNSQSLVVDTFIEGPYQDVFEIIIDLEQRMKWNKFANDIEFNDRLNQVGTKHICVFDNSTIEFVTVTADFGANTLVYGENMLSLPVIAKEVTIYFLVGEQGHGSKVSLAIHYKLKPWARLLEPFFRYKTTKTNQQTLAHLKEYCEKKLTKESLQENS